MFYKQTVSQMLVCQTEESQVLGSISRLATSIHGTDHEIVLQSHFHLPRIQDEQLSVNGKGIGASSNYWLNTYEALASPEKVWLG